MENILILHRKDIEVILNKYGLNCKIIEDKFNNPIYGLQANKENNTLTDIDIIFENSMLVSLSDLMNELENH